MRLMVMLVLAIAAGSVGIDAQKPAKSKPPKLDNYFSPRGSPTPIPARGPLELQTHDSEMRFRNIYIREIPAGTK